MQSVPRRITAETVKRCQNMGFPFEYEGVTYSLVHFHNVRGTMSERIDICAKIGMHTPAVVHLLEGTDSLAESSEAVNYDPTVEKLYIPGTVKELQDHACIYLTKLREVVFAKNHKLYSLGYRSFTNCTQLQRLDLRPLHSLEKIQGFCFNRCTNLQEVWLPQGLRIMYNAAFRDCWKLAKIHLPRQAQVQAQFPSSVQLIYY